MRAEHRPSEIVDRRKIRPRLKLSDRLQLCIRLCSNRDSQIRDRVDVLNLGTAHCKLRPRQLGLCACQLQAALFPGLDFHFHASPQVLHQLQVFLSMVNLLLLAQRVVEGVLRIGNDRECHHLRRRSAACYTKLCNACARAPLRRNLDGLQHGIVLQKSRRARIGSRTGVLISFVDFRAWIRILARCHGARSGTLCNRGGFLNARVVPLCHPYCVGKRQPELGPVAGRWRTRCQILLCARSRRQRFPCLFQMSRSSRASFRRAAGGCRAIAGRLRRHGVACDQS